MMRIINKIYIRFKKVILNILGVIRDMINKNSENEVEIMKTKCEMAKYVIEKTINGFERIFGSRKNRVVIGIFGTCASVGLILSGYIKLPEDEGEIDDEN